MHFVYKRLLRMLPRVAGWSNGPLSTLLRKQHEVDKAVHHDMVESAVEHGHVPGPCVCEEASGLMDDLYLAAHTSARPQRPSAVVTALKSIRIYLIRTWGRVLEAMPDDVLPTFRKKAATLQQREAEQHRQLIAFGESLRQDEDLDEHVG